jgi:uncharacterized membrane protein YgdD (TMEM256/DUF423 family)
MSTLQQMFLVFGAILGFFGVTAGSFGAHLLKSKLSGEMLQVFETAVRYQMYNALALIALASLLAVFHSTWFSFAGFFLMMGSVLFSGSLYLLVFSGQRYWGAVAPVGGVLMLLGWFSILLGSLLVQKI